MKNEDKIQRTTPELGEGLSSSQVKERKDLGLVNKTNIVVGKTYFEIIVSDVFSFFNILLFIIAGLMIAAQYWAGLSFLIVLIPNIGISLFEDIKARHLMSKLRVLTQPKAVVIRNKQKQTIELKDVVLDDLIRLENGDQISVDGPLLQGSLIVDESALTGESKNIIKNIGDTLYSGSFIVSGNGYMKADKIGEESYVETVQAKAKKFRRSPSEILRTLRYLFIVIGSVVSCMGIATFFIYFFRGGFATYDLFKQSMKGISGSMISMIPAGLFLLTSVALAVGVLKLSKKGARVQDFYSVEMLARVNILCVDKTGTITSDEMDVKKVVIYGGSDYTTEDISQIMSNILIATKDSNATAKSLQKAFNYDLTKGIVDALPFNSENKYCAASFKGGDTFVLGAGQFMNIPNQTALEHKTKEYTSKGYRVLVLAKTNAEIKNNKVSGTMNPIALIILQNKVRPEAIETFKWFKENGVKIKVISGDDPMTVSQVAYEAGIEGADRFISLAGKTDEEIISIVNEYDVFGRVKPEQKEVIINALKGNGNTVAMTGDGVNDILALKRADCSIAMNSGSAAAKNVSHIVLVNNDFDSLPGVVNEGRRVINNLQRVSALFLIKTMFSFVTSLAFLITMLTINVSYPFQATHFQIWSFINIGLASFFLALEANKDPLKGTFIHSIIKKAIPGVITMLVPVAAIYIMHVFQVNYVMYTGIYFFETATTMSVIVFTLLGLIILLKICLPFNKYRAFVFGGAVFLELGLLTAAALVSYFVGVEQSIIAIDFPSLTIVNWFTIGIIILITSTIYLITTYIVEVFKGEHSNAKN